MTETPTTQNTLTNRALRAERRNVALSAERDALQAKLDEAAVSLAAALSLAGRKVQDPTALDRLILGQAQDALAKIQAAPSP